MNDQRSACPLCSSTMEDIVWRNDRCRVILVNDEDYPGYCRVIWNRHVAEMSELSGNEAAHFMSVVFAVERVLRELMRPTKMNLASLGNVVPHLHWHVIPRFADDPHFPDAIWASRRRVGRPRDCEAGILRESLVNHLRAALGQHAQESVRYGQDPQNTRH